jgi:signal transduction histidine kinase
VSKRIYSSFGLRLRHKLAISLVIAALLPVLVAYWVGASVVLRGLERGLRAETEKQLSVGLNLLLRDIERLGNEATRLSARPRLSEALAEGNDALREVLDNEAQHLPATLIQVADAGGKIIGHRNVSVGRERFAGIGVSGESPSVQAGMTYERRVTVVRIDDRLVVRATAPIVDDRFRLTGVVVLSVPLDGLFSDRLKASLGADVLIIAGADAGGTPMMSFLDRLGARVRSWTSSRDVILEVASGQSAYENRPVIGHEYALGYAPIYDIEGHIAGVFGVAVDRAPVLEARGGATRSLALGAAGAFVFALGLAGLLSRRISRPLQTLHHGAIAIARGDLDTEISVAEGDEIGDLARAFSHMTTALKENQRRLAARMREIVALHDAGRAVSSVIEVDQVLRKVVDSVARVLHLRVCALWLVDTESENGESEGDTQLILGAARAKRSDMRTIGSSAEVDVLVSPLAALAQSVAESRGTLRVDSMADHPKFAQAAKEATIEGSLIASVLERKGSVIGVIVVGRGAAARPFSDADASLLSTFADQAASAIENASLYAKVRKFNEELEAKVQLRTTELQAINDEFGKTITELKETQAQLTLSERLAGLGQLVAGVAHEINSPSAAIRGTADTLAETVKRLTSRQGRLQSVLGDVEETSSLIDFCERVAPDLADKRRVPPAAVRRMSKELRGQLEKEGVSAETAAAVAKALAELDVDGDFLEEIRPYLLREEEVAQLVVDSLVDYVHVHRSTRTIQDAIRRIQRIVGSLKSYSHLDQDATRVEADIHEGIENTLVILEHQLSRGIQVERRYAALPGIPIFVDELNQVWTNLIHNAAQALEGKGQIVIETIVVNDGIAVRIIDNGPGIPDEVMTRIFDPFFTTRGKGEGTGLGLGIVRQIVEKHEGRVQCASEAGRTCFDVWLPKSVGQRGEA